jgi:hypothetical protein
MSIWKTLREEKPDWRKGSVIVLTTGGKIVNAWYVSERAAGGNGEFWSKNGVVRPIRYKRWCYEKDLVQQVLDEINSQ